MTFKTKIGLISKPELWLNLVCLKHRGAAETATSAERLQFQHGRLHRPAEAIALTVRSRSPKVHAHTAQESPRQTPLGGDEADFS